MDLVEKLISVPPREVSGGRTANRFSFQQVWAFDFMLKKMNSSADFVLIMELHDDILVLDCSPHPTCIDFFQIKTNTRASGYLTATTITQKAKTKADKASIVQKLIINYSNFRAETRSIHLVSNKRFNFGDLNNGISSTLRDSMKLSELNDIQKKKIKNNMCSACSCRDCSYSSGCNEICFELLYFDVSDLSLIDYENTTLGRFIKYLIDSGHDAKIGYAKSIYDAILSEIKRINNCEAIPANPAELFRLKSISKASFIEYIRRLQSSISSDDIWESIQMYLLHDGFPTIEVNQIAIQWKMLSLDSMNADNTWLKEMQEDIRHIKERSVAPNAKQFVDEVISAVSGKSYFYTRPKEYFIALAARELYV